MFCHTQIWGSVDTLINYITCMLVLKIVCLTRLVRELISNYCDGLKHTHFMFPVSTNALNTSDFKISNARLLLRWHAYQTLEKHKHSIHFKTHLLCWRYLNFKLMCACCKLTTQIAHQKQSSSPHCAQRINLIQQCFPDKDWLRITEVLCKLLGTFNSLRGCI
jgi:hypothetical protein